MLPGNNEELAKSMQFTHFPSVGKDWEEMIVAL